MLSGDKGFSMVEIIVALALLSLVAVGFLTLISFSANLIFNAGTKSEVIFEKQGVIENIIDESNPSGDDVIIVVLPPDEPDVSVSGKMLVVDYEYNDFSSSIVYFLPE